MAPSLHRHPQQEDHSTKVGYLTNPSLLVDRAAIARNSAQVQSSSRAVHPGST
jgi:hypothetical protein